MLDVTTKPKRKVDKPIPDIHIDWDMESEVKGTAIEAGDDPVNDVCIGSLGGGRLKMVPCKAGDVIADTGDPGYPVIVIRGDKCEVVRVPASK
jgi:hypothetical protein